MTVEMTPIFPLHHLQTGLIVACYQGYVDVVIALSQCPYVDVNWQDNEGNTALMTAAQAGKGNEGMKLQSATPSRSPWAFIRLFYETRANILSFIILRVKVVMKQHIFSSVLWHIQVKRIIEKEKKKYRTRSQTVERGDHDLILKECLNS